MSVAVAAILLGLVSVPVFAAARSPRLAEAAIRLPPALRRSALRRPATARVAIFGLWVAAWTAALGAVADGTGKPALGLAVGAVVGIFVGAAGAMAMTFAIHEWEARALGPRLTTPAPVTTVCAADLDRPCFTPAFPQMVASAATRGTWSRTERTMRWVRNGCATLLFVVLVLGRATMWRSGSEMKMLFALLAIVLIALAAAAFGVLGLARAAREREVVGRTPAEVSVASVCKAHGWTRGSLEPGLLRRRWPGVPFFADDKDHRVRAFVRGRVEPYDLCVIDERGTPPGTSSLLMRETRQTVYLVSMPGVRLPRLSVSARHARYLPQQRVNRPLELEAFNRIHHVLCDNPAFVSAVLTPRMMSLVMAGLPAGGQLVLCGDALAIVVPGRLRLSLLEPTVALLVEALKLMPTYLLRQYSTVRPDPVTSRRSPA